MQVGDRVRTTEKSIVSYSGPVGTEGTIVAIDEDAPFGYTCIFDIEPDHANNDWVMSADEIEPLDAR